MQDFQQTQNTYLESLRVHKEIIGAPQEDKKIPRLRGNSSLPQEHKVIYKRIKDVPTHFQEHNRCKNNT